MNGPATEPNEGVEPRSGPAAYETFDEFVRRIRSNLAPLTPARRALIATLLAPAGPDGGRR